MNPILSVNRLSKSYNNLRAVNNLSFSVTEGEIYGFLGQNGAGKSTTIRMLLTLIAPTEGNIEIFGLQLAANRERILAQVGAIIEKPDLYGYLTAFENLQLIARLYQRKPEKKHLMFLLERTGLAERAHSKVRTFSQGMKQRLGIASALINDPRLIILDEPTNGLDPQGIADVRNLILTLSREDGKTIFVSSHLLSEIELIADSMLIIDQGSKVVEGKVADLLNPARTVVELATTDNMLTRDIVASSQWASGLTDDEKLVLQLHRNEIPELIRFLVGKNVDIVSLQSRHSLEDYFLSLTKGNRHVATYRN